MAPPTPPALVGGPPLLSDEADEKEPGSPHPQDLSEEPAKEVSPSEEEMASQGDETMETDVKPVSTNDLSDVSLPPANPIPVLKNSIKLRLSR